MLFFTVAFPTIKFFKRLCSRVRQMLHNKEFAVDKPFVHCKNAENFSTKALAINIVLFAL